MILPINNLKCCGEGSSTLDICYTYDRYVPQPDQGDIIWTRDEGTSTGTLLRGTWANNNNFYSYPNRIYTIDRLDGTREVDYDFVITIPPAGQPHPETGAPLVAGDQLTFRFRTWNNTATVSIDGQTYPSGTTSWVNHTVTYTVGSDPIEFPVNVDYATAGTQNDPFQMELFLNGVRDATIADAWYSDDGGAAEVIVDATETLDSNGVVVNLVVGGVAAPENSTLWDEFYAAKNAGLAVVVPCTLAGSSKASISKTATPNVAGAGDQVTFNIDFEVVLNDDGFNVDIRDILDQTEFSFVSASTTIGTLDFTDPYVGGITTTLTAPVAGTTGTLTIVADKLTDNTAFNRSTIEFDSHIVAESEIPVALLLEPTDEVCCPKYVGGQPIDPVEVEDGTAANPFTSISNACGVPTAGVYHFNIAGVDFTTNVDENGYVKVATETQTADVVPVTTTNIPPLPTSTALDSDARGILAASVIAAQTDVETIRLKSTDGITDAETSTAGVIARYLAFQALHNGTAENSINQNWVGDNSAALNAPATNAGNIGIPSTALDAMIKRASGNGAAYQWTTFNSVQRNVWTSGEIATGEKFELWVKGEPCVAASPFTSLSEAASVTVAGIYNFDIGGNTFSTYVDENGYVQILRDFGDGVGALPQSSTITDTARGILTPAILALLTDIVEARISNEGAPEFVDAITTDSTIISRIQSNTTLHQGLADNAINDTWTGFNAAVLTGDATSNSPNGSNLHENVYHVSGNTSTFNLIPILDTQRVEWSAGEIAANESLVVWAKGTELAVGAYCYALNADGDYVDADGNIALEEELISAGYTCEYCSCSDSAEVQCSTDTVELFKDGVLITDIFGDGITVNESTGEIEVVFDGPVDPNHVDILIAGLLHGNNVGNFTVNYLDGTTESGVDFEFGNTNAYAHNHFGTNPWGTDNFFPALVKMTTPPPASFGWPSTAPFLAFDGNPSTGSMQIGAMVHLLVNKPVTSYSFEYAGLGTSPWNSFVQPHVEAGCFSASGEENTDISTPVDLGALTLNNPQGIVEDLANARIAPTDNHTAWQAFYSNEEFTAPMTLEWTDNSPIGVRTSYMFGLQASSDTEVTNNSVGADGNLIYSYSSFHARNYTNTAAAGGVTGISTFADGPGIVNQIHIDEDGRAVFYIDGQLVNAVNVTPSNENTFKLMFSLTTNNTFVPPVLEDISWRTYPSGSTLGFG